jgi:hypothetical protein
MHLTVNGKIVKKDPLPIDVWEAINSAENPNDTISLHKKNNEYLEAILNVLGGFQLKYKNKEGSFKTKIHSLDEDEVKKIFNDYYFDELEWKKHFRWEKKSLSNRIKNDILVIFAFAFLILLVINKFDKDVVIDKIYKLFEGNAVISYLVFVLVFAVLIYSDFDYIRNYNRITGYNKLRVTTYIFVIPILLLLYILLFKN